MYLLLCLVIPLSLSLAPSGYALFLGYFCILYRGWVGAQIGDGWGCQLLQIQIHE
jgi:hypothetical protein